MLHNMLNGIRKIRPVGNLIVTRHSPLELGIFGEREITFYHSGTAALAAALLALKSLNTKKARSPEVLLPAYTCPDLISACVYSGITPVLIDLDESTCWMSIDMIKQAITPNTIGIIAVRFLGIAERMSKLRAICDEHKLTLIEDSAQGFPVQEAARYWQGDIVILSFGRGKPVNTLGGGAVLTNKPDVLAHLPNTHHSLHCSLLQKITFYGKVKSYNALINPILYNAATKLPGLNIGETAYKPLTSISAIPACTKRYLADNIKAYQARNLIGTHMHQALDRFRHSTLTDLPGSLSHNFSEPLLRYPILIRDKALRDRLLLALHAFGASKMYGLPLNQIKNIPDNIFRIPGPLKNAFNFSQQLLTLPTHTDVSKNILEEIFRTIKNICK